MKRALFCERRYWRPRPSTSSMKHSSVIALSLGAALTGMTSASVAAQRAVPEQREYPHGSEPIGSVRQIYDGVLTPEMAVNTFRNIHRLFPTRVVPRASTPMPLPPATKLLAVSFIDRGRRYHLEDYLELNRVAALLVLCSTRMTASALPGRIVQRDAAYSGAGSLGAAAIANTPAPISARAAIRCVATFRMLS